MPGRQIDGCALLPFGFVAVRETGEDDGDIGGLGSLAGLVQELRAGFAFLVAAWGVGQEAGADECGQFVKGVC